MPVTFVAGSQTLADPAERARASTEDWDAAVDEALDKGGGFGVLRGYRRLGLRLFGGRRRAGRATPTTPRSTTRSACSRRTIDRPHRDARLVRHGLAFDGRPAARPGKVLDREAAAAARRRRARRLGARARSSSRSQVDPPEVTVARAPPRARTRDARRLGAGHAADRHRELRRRAAAARGDAASCRTAAARSSRSAARPRTRTSRKLDREVSTPAKNASFVVGSDGHDLGLAGEAGRRARRAARRRRGCSRPRERAEPRVAPIVVATSKPERSTADGEGDGDHRRSSAPTRRSTAAIANRIHNVQLVAQLIDGKLIAPGATFSFNDATGERTADKGFLEAPVIINGELSTGLGGGICQVSTTVFNAAYEAGLPITSRTNHALYISHYPLGRDATVNYPDIDLKFVNDTGKWLLLRTFVGSSSLVVNLYGTPQHRRVETETAPLRVVAPAPVEQAARRLDRAGQRASSRSTAFRRRRPPCTARVYAASGKLLSDATWVSNYELGAEDRPDRAEEGEEAEKPAQEPARTRGRNATAGHRDDTGRRRGPLTPTGPAPPQ